MYNFQLKVILLAFAMVMFSLPAIARSPSPLKGPADLYFLAVGVSSYIDPDFKGFKAPRNSAKLVANLLRENGARFGILLTEKKGNDALISRKDVYNALFKLKKKIRSDGSKNARILIYFIGHGLADATSNYLNMLPGNVSIDPQPVPQNDVFRLAKLSVFSLDILTSLMSFRRDPRLEHLDEHLLTDRMSEANGFRRLVEQSQLEAEYSAYLQQKSASYGSAPFDNAPIPFVVLLDNCTDGFQYELVHPNPIMNLMVQAQYNATLDVGRAYYAIQPGQSVTTRILPADLVPHKYKEENALSPFVGPLAIHLARILHNRDPDKPMTLHAFNSAMLSDEMQNSENYPDLAFAAPARLRDDVADVEFLPTKVRRMDKWDEPVATGHGRVNCCGSQ